MDELCLVKFPLLGNPAIESSVNINLNLNVIHFKEWQHSMTIYKQAQYIPSGSLLICFDMTHGCGDCRYLDIKTSFIYIYNVFLNSKFAAIL